MSTDHTVITNFCKNTQGGIHSNQNIIADSGTMDDGAMPHGDIVTDDDVRHPRMDDTIILNAAIASNFNSESISSQNRSRPDAGIFSNSYIPDQIGILADKNGGINLWFFLPESSNHKPNPLL
jgi:hypothetical protein